MGHEELQLIRNFCYAVVEQAIIDYKQALKWLLVEGIVNENFLLLEPMKHAEHINWKMKEECEAFFYHDDLVKATIRHKPQDIITKIRKQVLEACKV